MLLALVLGATVAILLSLARLHQKANQIMSTEADLQTNMDALKALVQKLVDQLNAPSAVTQEQLDALNAEATAILGTTPTPPAV